MYRSTCLICLGLAIGPCLPTRHLYDDQLHTHSEYPVAFLPSQAAASASTAARALDDGADWRGPGYGGVGYRGHSSAASALLRQIIDAQQDEVIPSWTTG
jgi:hypothetical protein